MVNRFDTDVCIGLDLSHARRDAAGALSIAVRISRAGNVQVYPTAGGGTREYRPESEVFAKEAMATCQGVLATIGHPGMVATVADAQRLGVGYLKDAHRDGVFVGATLIVLDEATIGRVLSGELCELSAGYSCDLVPRSGTTPEGEAFDHVQRTIRLNHVALLGRGQARAPGAWVIG